MTTPSTTFETIKGLLGDLNEEEMNMLIAEISFKHNVGIPQWYSASKIQEMSKQITNTELDSDDVAYIITQINESDPYLVDDIPLTYIDLYVKESELHPNDITSIIELLNVVDPVS
jgi:hypothetical protein